MDRPIVLIVDDQPFIAAMVKGVFEDAGFDVRTALNAEEAQTQVSELGPRLSALITDNRLGEGSNGWAVAVEAWTRMPLLPVVYMTGDSADEWTAFGVPKASLSKNRSSAPTYLPR